MSGNFMLIFCVKCFHTSCLTAGNHSWDKGLALVLCPDKCCVTRSGNAFFFVKGWICKKFKVDEKKLLEPKENRNNRRDLNR